MKKIITLRNFFFNILKKKIKFLYFSTLLIYLFKWSWGQGPVGAATAYLISCPREGEGSTMKCRGYVVNLPDQNLFERLFIYYHILGFVWKKKCNYSLSKDLWSLIDASFGLFFDIMTLNLFLIYVKNQI